MVSKGEKGEKKWEGHVIYFALCLFVSPSLYLVRFVKPLRYAGKRNVNIMKVYIEMNNSQVELIRCREKCWTLFTLTFVTRRIQCHIAARTQIRRSNQCHIASINHFRYVSDSLVWSYYVQMMGYWEIIVTKPYVISKEAQLYSL